MCVMTREQCVKKMNGEMKLVSSDHPINKIKCKKIGKFKITF